ncbi:hypothetical protein NDU88_008762 [Pleurodeles waltl]|uniref:Uncharacterized protein n=1 Tax=Pleurodeles waltl TaxID=8319 RepID=A0AAV7NWZ9_PLEWA|nr:hypothetical protein NDU88_008762 [Pleurodeles waltl]
MKARRLVETARHLVETARRLVETARRLVETARRLVETARHLVVKARRLVILVSYYSTFLVGKFQKSSRGRGKETMVIKKRRQQRDLRSVKQQVEENEKEDWQRAGEETVAYAK